MKKHLPLLTLLAGGFFLNTQAQQTDRFAYAVTDMGQGPNWNFLRKLDLQTGEFSQVLLNGNDGSIHAYDARSRKAFDAPVTDRLYGAAANAAFATGVAAMAYDKKNDRLYYTPMMIDQLRYIDMRTMRVYYAADRGFSGQPQKSSDQGNIITRMVIASDGYGYAMTNDATQLIRFSTNKKMEITDLGSIVDDQSNKGISIHNSCSSYGGDMIADDNGNIYVFSARNQVFRINIETKVATHLGTVNGLPAGYSINAAAVDASNRILVGSAAVAGGLYTFDLKSMTATPFVLKGSGWQTSDMANGNLLATGTTTKGTTIDLIATKTTPDSGEGRISIYPNPVTDNQFVIQFNHLASGTYAVQVTDVTGRQVITQQVAVSGDNQAQTIRIGKSATKGIYMVKVVDGSSRQVYTTKIVLQ